MVMAEMIPMRAMVFMASGRRLFSSSRAPTLTTEEFTIRKLMVPRARPMQAPTPRR